MTAKNFEDFPKHLRDFVRSHPGGWPAPTEVGAIRMPLRPELYGGCGPHSADMTFPETEIRRHEFEECRNAYVAELHALAVRLEGTLRETSRLATQVALAENPRDTERALWDLVPNRPKVDDALRAAERLL